MAQIQINKSGLDAIYRQVAASIERVDQQLRERVGGLPIETVEPEARAALAGVGVQLPPDSLRGYSQSIVDGADFEFVLT
jgi:hypothetical protein